MRLLHHASYLPTHYMNDESDAIRNANVAYRQSVAVQQNINLDNHPYDQLMCRVHMIDDINRNAKPRIPHATDEGRENIKHVKEDIKLLACVPFENDFDKYNLIIFVYIIICLVVDAF